MAAPRRYAGKLAVPVEMFPVMAGLCTYYLARGDYRKLGEFAAELVEIGRKEITADSSTSTGGVAFLPCGPGALLDFVAFLPAVRLGPNASLTAPGAA